MEHPFVMEYRHYNTGKTSNHNMGVPRSPETQTILHSVESHSVKVKHQIGMSISFLLGSRRRKAQRSRRQSLSKVKMMKDPLHHGGGCAETAQIHLSTTLGNPKNLIPVLTLSPLLVFGQMWKCHRLMLMPEQRLQDNSLMICHLRRITTVI